MGSSTSSARDSVQQGAYVNHLRVGDWRALFSRVWPGCHIDASSVEEDNRFVEELARARQAGELEGYDDDELLTDRVQVLLGLAPKRTVHMRPNPAQQESGRLRWAPQGSDALNAVDRCRAVLIRDAQRRASK